MCCGRPHCLSSEENVAGHKLVGALCVQRKLPAGDPCWCAHMICSYIGYAPSRADAAPAAAALAAVKARRPCSLCASIDVDHVCALPPLHSSDVFCRTCGAMLMMAALGSHHAWCNERKAAEMCAALAVACGACIALRCPCAR